MAQPLRNPEELQKNLEEFQELSRQVQVMAAQRQQLSFQVEELKIAEEIISKSTKETIYRAIGPILIETSKSDALADINERKELYDLRIGMLLKQEEKLRPRIEELRSELEKALKESRQK
ncbi:MAG: prefoldin subunit beta [Candidatus Micrarchaeota archaeon]|nr:prefoldin subunit beta [Candidatus Micrarchaeota archaeon]